MRHRLFKLASAISLLLLVALALIWVRSYWVSDGLTWTSRAATICAARSGGGRVELMRATSDPSACVESEESRAFEKPKAGREEARGAKAEREAGG